jgi:uncharacterized protein (DUF488 family)
VGLLTAHGVSVVFDVRSSPYSSRFPHFNRSDLSTWLENRHIRYYFAGRHLGGRPADQSLYIDNQACYSAMAKSTAFISALRRIASWTSTARCALLCAEGDPLECHRFLLIGRQLHERGFEVRHILSNGASETHKASEHRLLSTLGLLQSDIFDSRADAITAAYDLQASRVAYTGSPGQDERHGRHRL